MKRYLILIVLLVAGLSACQKIQSNSIIPKQAVIDDQKIQDYIKANNIAATKDANTGVYYQIIKPGDTNTQKPNALSTVKITYTNKYLNGLTIGTTTDLQARVSSFIGGLQVGILKLYTGGRVLLIIPSNEAYGTSSTNGIPANSVLVYTLDLNGVGTN